MKNFILITLIILFCSSQKSYALVSPVGVSLFPPLEFPTKGSSIVGLRLDLIVGKHQNVYGIDLGLIANVVADNMVGLEVAGIFNKAKTAVGLQVGLINRAESLYGLQIGLINIAKNLHGIQIGLINVGGRVIKFLPIINFGF